MFACRVLEGKGALYCGQCAVGDVILSISYIVPGSLDHVEQLGMRVTGTTYLAKTKWGALLNLVG